MTAIISQQRLVVTLALPTGSADYLACLRGVDNATYASGKYGARYVAASARPDVNGMSVYQGSAILRTAQSPEQIQRIVAAIRSAILSNSAIAHGTVVIAVETLLTRTDIHDSTPVALAHPKARCTTEVSFKAQVPRAMSCADFASAAQQYSTAVRHLVATTGKSQRISEGDTPSRAGGPSRKGPVQVTLPLQLFGTTGTAGTIETLEMLMLAPAMPDAARIQELSQLAQALAAQCSALPKHLSFRAPVFITTQTWSERIEY